MTDRDRRVPGRQRLLALLSLLATAALAAVTIAFLVRNGLYVALGLAGFVVAVCGAWWWVTKRMPRRAVGMAVLVGGAALLVGAVVGAAADAEQLVVHLVVVAGILAVAVLAARASLAGDVGARARRASRRAVPPSHPVLLCNPRSGGGKVDRFGLVELASSLGVETVLLGEGQDLEALARDSIARGADCLGMAGGDGSQALVASIAVEHDIPFVCVPAGTRNHFALDLCLDRDDPRSSIPAFRDGIERRVDFATVGGRFFVNNVSLGVYATIVQEPGYREAKAETATQLLPELLGNTERPFDLQFATPDGTEVDGAFLVQVSNNPYVLGASLDVSQRRRLDSGRLGVFAIAASTGAQAAQALTFALGGAARRSSHVFEFTAEGFEVRSRSGTAYAGVDGEALDLATPLRFRIHPRGLRVLVPAGNVELALKREAREVRLADAFSLVRGSVPARLA